MSGPDEWCVPKHATRSRDRAHGAARRGRPELVDRPWVELGEVAGERTRDLRRIVGLTRRGVTPASLDRLAEDLQDPCVVDVRTEPCPRDRQRAERAVRTGTFGVPQLVEVPRLGEAHVRAARERRNGDAGRHPFAILRRQVTDDVAFLDATAVVVAPRNEHAVGFTRLASQPLELRVTHALEPRQRALEEHAHLGIPDRRELVDALARGQRVVRWCVGHHASEERALALVERIGGSEAGVVGQVEAARALANLRVFDRAFEHLEAAARIDPDAPEVLDAQADLFVRASRDADAERALERRIALAADSTDPAVLEAAEQAEVRLVASWARRGSIPEHRADLEARHARGDASASRMLADVQRRAGQLEAALATLVALSERRPDDARLVAVLARLHHERGDYDAEVRALLRLSELEPARAGWHLSRLVELALATYRDDDAIRFADEATRRSLDDPELHLRLGRLHARRRDPTRAALAYARAIELDPDAHEAAWELAGLERERGASRRALELLLGILVRSRDDDLRERAGRALLETARADGSEESLEPRLLALALAHGDAPVFQRLALSLYTALTVAARARGDEAAIGRWVSRSLPVLLTALRDDDVGARSSARQLLFAHPVPGASQALLAMAADESVDTLSRQEALAAALHVITERDGPALEALLSSPSEVLASLALHGLARLGERSPRAARSRLAALRVARARPGRVGMNAWALTILVGGETLRDAGATAGAAATSNAWLDGWAQAATSAVAPSSDVLRALLLRHAARRERDDPTLHPQIDLLASGLVDDASLDALARAALVDDEHGRIAMRALLSRPRPTLACAPVPARAEGLEGWMERAIAGCPRTPREPEVVVGALLRAVAALGEAGVPAALELVAAHGREASWGPIVAPVATALVRRTLPVAAASPDACLSLVALAQIVPDLLTAEDWRALLARPERTVRAAAAAGAPVPGLSAPLVDVVVTDPAWTVRRAALQRLAVASIDPSDLERAVSASLVDDSAFVRSEAISLAETLSDARACALLGAVAADPDPWVLERVRSVTSRRCAR